MKRRTNIFAIFVAAIVTVILAAAVLAFVSRPKMPVYQGKSAEAWLRQSDQTEAMKAFRTMGTNAFPFLLHKLKMRNTGWDKGFDGIFHSIGDLIGEIHLQLLHAFVYHTIAGVASPFCRFNLF